MMKFLNKRTYGKKGFTIVEALIYVVILGLLFALTTQATLTMFQAFSGMQRLRDLTQSGGVSAERIVREIRSATSIDFTDSSFGVNPGVLKLNTHDSLGDDAVVEFFVSGGKLHVSEDDVDQGPLVLSHVTVDRLVFFNVTESGVPAIRFELEMTSSRGGRTETRFFSGAAVLRNTYE